jgi:hypothetical protein
MVDKKKSADSISGRASHEMVMHKMFGVLGVCIEVEQPGGNNR